jgi:hypothetical protein
VPYLFPETIMDSISVYLRKEDIIPQSDSIRWSFGQFEYLSTTNNGVLFNDSAYDNSYSLISKGMEGSLASLPLQTGSVFFIIFLLCFAIFSFVFSRERTTFTGNFNAIISLRSRPTATYKEQVATTEIWGEFFMIFQAILIFSIILFTYLWKGDFYLLTIKSFTISFLLIFLILSILAGLKFLVYKSISFFFLHKDIKNWINKYFRLLELLGVVLFLPAILYLYLPEIRPVMQVVILLVIVVSRLIVLIELSNIFVKNKVGGFYFFVYLCGTEIAPYLIYYKGVVLLISIAGNNII